MCPVFFVPVNQAGRCGRQTVTAISDWRCLFEKNRKCPCWDIGGCAYPGISGYDRTLRHAKQRIQNVLAFLCEILLVYPRADMLVCECRVTLYFGHKLLTKIGNEDKIRLWDVRI